MASDNRFDASHSAQLLGGICAGRVSKKRVRHGLNGHMRCKVSTKIVKIHPVKRSVKDEVFGVYLTTIDQRSRGNVGGEMKPHGLR